MMNAKTKALAVFFAFLPLMLHASPQNARAETLLKRSPGERAFVKHCVKCHGENASGTDKGPPLVHKVYHPNHHADASFRMAVRFGVRAHHWRFGNMPRIKDATPEEVDSIIKYIRRLQKEAGIY